MLDYACFGGLASSSSIGLSYETKDQTRLTLHDGHHYNHYPVVIGINVNLIPIV